MNIIKVGYNHFKFIDDPSNENVDHLHAYLDGKSQSMQVVVPKTQKV